MLLLRFCVLNNINLLTSLDRFSREEDVLSYIAFPQQAEQYFQRRENTFTASYTIKEVG